MSSLDPLSFFPLSGVGTKAREKISDFLDAGTPSRPGRGNTEPQAGRPRNRKGEREIESEKERKRKTFPILFQELDANIGSSLPQLIVVSILNVN